MKIERRLVPVIETNAFRAGDKKFVVGLLAADAGQRLIAPPDEAASQLAGQCGRLGNLRLRRLARGRDDHDITRLNIFSN